MGKDEERTAAARALYLLLAVVVSAAIWYYVDEFGNNGGPFSAEMEIAQIPVEFIGEASLADRGLMLTDQEEPPTVDITFGGARRLVTELERSQVRLTADVSAITSPGVQTVRYTISYLDREGRTSFPVNQKFSRLSISRRTETVSVDVQELTGKSVDIRCEVMGNVAEGYSAGKPELSQSVLEVQGLDEAADAVSYAKVTLDLGGAATESVDLDLPIQFCDESGQVLDDDGLYPSADQIHVHLPVYTTKELPLLVDFIEAPGARLRNVDHTIRPETITVSGEASSLAGVSSLTVGQMALLDLIGTQGTTTHTFSIAMPEGCTNQSGVTRATLEISFRDLTTREIDVGRSSVDMEVPEGKTVTVLTEGLSVTIFGTTQAVGSVAADDVRVTPDLSDYASASGTYTVAAAVSVPSQRDVGVSGEYQIQVDIQDSPDAQDAASSGGAPEGTGGSDGSDADTDEGSAGDAVSGDMDEGSGAASDGTVGSGGSGTVGSGTDGSEIAGSGTDAAPDTGAAASDGTAAGNGSGGAPGGDGGTT